MQMPSSCDTIMSKVGRASGLTCQQRSAMLRNTTDVFSGHAGRSPITITCTACRGSRTRLEKLSLHTHTQSVQASHPRDDLGVRKRAEGVLAAVDLPHEHAKRVDVRGLRQAAVH